jgi:flagellar protein FlaF
MSANNPYTTAAGAYGNTAAATDQRSLEGQVLMKSAMKLEALQKRLQAEEPVSYAEIGETLEYNQKLWQLFVNETINPDHPLPQDIKNSIASLGVFVFKRTKELLAEPQASKFNILVDINRNIASGLMKQAALPATPATPAGKAADKTDSMI